MIEMECPLQTPIVEHNMLRDGDNDYVFGCEEKFWNFPDSFKMCTLKGTTIDWLIDTPSTNHGFIIDTIKKYSYPDLNGKVMVSGAHFIPNLRDRLFLGEGPIKTTQLSLMLIDDLKKKGIEVDFLTIIDDLYMMYDYVRLDTASFNYYRDSFFNPLIVPGKLANMINEYQGETGNKFKFFYSTEKTLADRFNRHAKNKKYSMVETFVNGKNFQGYNDGDWFVKVNGLPIRVIENNKPNCVAAIADLVKDVEHITINRKVWPHYNCLIAFFPSCSINNVIDGLKVAAAFYKTSLRIFIIFTTTKCF